MLFFAYEYNFLIFFGFCNIAQGNCGIAGFILGQKSVLMRPLCTYTGHNDVSISCFHNYNAHKFYYGKSLKFTETGTLQSPALRTSLVDIQKINPPKRLGAVKTKIKTKLYVFTHSSVCVCEIVLFERVSTIKAERWLW